MGLFTKLCIRECPLWQPRSAMGFLPSFFLGGLVATASLAEVPVGAKSVSPTGMYSQYESSYGSPYDVLHVVRVKLQLEELVPEILNTIRQLSPYSKPHGYPTVVYLSAEELGNKACGKPCGVLGHYAGGEAIYLDNRLKPETDLFDRSVLLHELVHYLQEANGSYQIRQQVPEDGAQCLTWLAREIEAYEIQATYLQMVDGPVKRAFFPKNAHCN